MADPAAPSVPSPSQDDVEPNHFAAGSERRPRAPTIDRFSLRGVKAVGVERAPFKDIYHFILKRTWPQFFLLVALVFFLVNLFFACLFHLGPGAIANVRPGSYEDAFYFSVQTLATIGYGGMYPVSRYGHAIVAVEATAGVLMFALITGLTFTRFARPSARVLFSGKAVISPRNGVPHLMFRMANWRRNRIVEARLSITLLVTERTREGDVMRRQIDLPLLRDKTNVFFLTWTAMHAVDAASPFFGPDALTRLRACDADIFLALTGLDETIGQPIHVRKQYALDDIVPGARFADVLTTQPDGTRVIDYRRFHDVVRLDPAPPATLP